jgi:hypothetical protein
LRSFAQRFRSCSKIRHVKCSEMYLNTNRNHSQQKPVRSREGKECYEISYLDIDLKNITKILWTGNLSSPLEILVRYGPLEKMKLAGENGIIGIYDLQSYWTSMTVNPRSRIWSSLTLLTIFHSG